MGVEPPLPPISVEEFKRRVGAGARTMREIDPVFAAWLTRPDRSNLFGLLKQRKLNAKLDERIIHGEGEG